MEQRVQEELTLIKNTIVETIPVERIYLFGSYAYGIPNGDSDLDIYVVMKDEAPYQLGEARELIGKALFWKKSMSTDILVSNQSRFQYRQSAPTLEHEVVTKGVIIYGFLPSTLPVVTSAESHYFV